MGHETCEFNHDGKNASLRVLPNYETKQTTLQTTEIFCYLAYFEGYNSLQFSYTVLAH